MHSGHAKLHIGLARKGKHDDPSQAAFILRGVHQLRRLQSSLGCSALGRTERGSSLGLVESEQLGESYAECAAQLQQGADLRIRRAVL